MNDKVCYCPNCCTDTFNPGECMFCQSGIAPEGGRLRSKNNARMCVECLKKCNKLLTNADKKEKILK